SDTTICDSQTVRTFFEKRYGAKIHYIPYGAKHIESVSDVYKTFGLEHRNYFIFVGRLVPEKGVECLLEAYNMLSTDLPLVIVGDNEDDPEYVASLHRHAGNNVRFFGYRYGDEYESLLLHSCLYITASKLEGTSPSLLAAMGAHVCCLVNSIPENRETGGDSVVYFNGTSQDLLAKLELLIEHPRNH
ncbi:glycosyl transferase, group 1, partial [mine drainage metagenome]